MRDHTQLRAVESADEVVMLVYRTTAGFPKEELFGLTSQIWRAAVSVPPNIVEGCACDSEAEYLRFLNIAFGSLRELPIYPPDRIRETKPDYLFILPWNLKNEIMDQMVCVREWGDNLLSQFLSPQSATDSGR